MPNVISVLEQYATLRTQLDNGVLTVTLNRPERLNAFNQQMMLDMLALYEAVDAEDRVRAVIITGAGRGFCAGADLSSGGGTFDSGAAPKGDGKPKPAPRDGGGRVALRIFDCKKPIIAAINGAAVGVGITHTLPMDIRIASTKSKFVGNALWRTSLSFFNVSRRNGEHRSRAQGLIERYGGIKSFRPRPEPGVT